MEWKIVYQSTPYNYTEPQVLIIEAASREQALVLAYDRLTRQGHAVNADGSTFDLRAVSIDWDAARRLGWPILPTLGGVHIRSIEAHPGTQPQQPADTETITLTREQWDEVRRAVLYTQRQTRSVERIKVLEEAYEQMVSQGSTQATDKVMRFYCKACPDGDVSCGNVQAATDCDGLICEECGGSDWSPRA